MEDVATPLKKSRSSKSRLILDGGPSLPGSLAETSVDATFNDVFTNILALSKSALYDAIPKLYTPKYGQRVSNAKKRRQLSDRSKTMLANGSGKDAKNSDASSSGLLDMNRVIAFLGAEMKNFSVLSRGLSLLHKYAWRSVEERDQICGAKEDFVPLLLSALAMHVRRGDASFVEDACGLLAVMLSPLSRSSPALPPSVFEDEKDAVNRQNCGALLKALTVLQGQEAAVEDICRVLAELSHFSSVRSFFIDLSVPNFGVLLDGDRDGFDDDDVESLPTIGTADLAVETLRRHLTDGGVCQETLGWLANLLSDEVDGRTVALRAIEAGLCGALVSVLTTHGSDAEVTTRAAGVVANVLLNMHEILMMRLNDSKEEEQTSGSEESLISLLPEVEFVQSGGVSALLDAWELQSRGQREGKVAAAVEDLRDGCLSALLQLLFTSQVSESSSNSVTSKLQAARSLIALTLKESETLGSLLRSFGPFCLTGESLCQFLDVVYSYLCLEDAIMVEAEQVQKESEHCGDASKELVDRLELEKLVEHMLTALQEKGEDPSLEFCAVLRRLPALQVMRHFDESVWSAVEDLEQRLLVDVPAKDMVFDSLTEVADALAQCE